MLCSLPRPKHPFELYDIDTDRIQAKDVADDHPDVVRRMEQAYHDWSKRVGVVGDPPRAGDAPKAAGKGGGSGTPLDDD